MAGSLPRRAAGLVVAALVTASVIALVIVDDDDREGRSSGVSAVGLATTTTTTARPPSTIETTPAPMPVTTSTSTGRTSTPATVAPTTPTTATPTTAPCPQPSPGSDFDDFGAEEIVIDARGGLYESCVVAATTPQQLQRGLMHQDDLDGYAGMVFTFSTEEHRTFWMRNTRIPLSIAFFDAQGRFVSATDMEPCGDSEDCPRYTSNGPAAFALEVPKGGLSRVGAIPGSRLHA